MVAGAVLVIGACLAAQTANTPGVPTPRTDAGPPGTAPAAGPPAPPVAAADSATLVPPGAHPPAREDPAPPAGELAPGSGPPASGGVTPIAPLHLPSPMLEARTIAREAYVYGVPLVSSYASLYALAVDKGGPNYKGPFNTLVSVAQAPTPDDTASVAPNADTLYTFAGLDLRAEPVVLTVPPMEKERYFAFQLIDLYTYNFAYAGTRRTGNGGGRFLIAGPNWTGTAPADISRVIRADTELVSLIGRTQLFGASDLDKVKAIQAGYKLELLSTVTGRPAPRAPAVDWLKPARPRELRSSLEFYDILAFALQFAPPSPAEAALRERFATIGVVPGRRFAVTDLSNDMKAALYTGMAEGQRTIDTRRTALGGRVDGLFGTREMLADDYVARALGAQVGFGANSRDEALFPLYELDAKGQPLDGSEGRYTLRFAKGRLPPVNAFWSLTLYDAPSRRLVANPINRYLINSSMLPSLKRDRDGGVTIHIQNQPPGGDKDANWLPAPDGPFVLALRYYWPKPELLNGTWPAPRVDKLPEPTAQAPSHQRPAARPARAAGR
ncbi:hypothetical protein GCM10010994_20050 [Chelatococcus reniformis]|uniref:Cell envelope protein n=2 Tax=Chelatococcus reniformis TaxID=1494448 RepID=A0A916U6Z9_9HYPH|nr:hypothetical protein GCM10010994_20050 [Chelatococcus reniformis]